MKKYRFSWRRAFVGVALAALVGAPQAELVNDDTDVFLTNPNITTQFPNVLILIDNTANWGTVFEDEKAALVNAVGGLSETYRVGLGLFAQAGVGTGTVNDGAFIRYAVRQMNGTNRNAMTSMVSGFRNETVVNGGDKGNNAVPSLAMAESFRYFAGMTSRTTYQQMRADVAGNTANNSAASLGNNALASATSGATYRTPITDACQKNFIIYISNGPASENVGSLSTSLNELRNARGSTPATIALTPSGQQDNWADEWAEFMATSGVPYGTARATVSTYTVEVNPGVSGQGPDMTALLKSMAERGKGKYFPVTGGNGGSEIAAALDKIFKEINAVNTVFAATTLPVSVNVRGTNLNQVYIGVFRPDETLRPRWFGNLKLYKLSLNESTGSVFLADADGRIAENAGTGFITNSARSFWTEPLLQPQNFWAFRDSSLNGFGGASDSPDGDLVEKGGAAQQLRRYYSFDSTANAPARELYTCTTASGAGCLPCTLGGGAEGTGTCTNPTVLSGTPFATSNTHIGAGFPGLELSSVQVQSMTGLSKQTLTALTDKLPVSLNNAADPFNILSISNGATSTVTLERLTTTKTVQVASISAKAEGAPIGLTSVSRGSGGSSSQITFRTNMTTAWASPVAVGQYINLTGVRCNGVTCMTGRYQVADVGTINVSGTRYHTFTVVDNLASGTLTLAAGSTASRLSNTGTAILTLASGESNPFLGVSGSRTITFTVPAALGAFSCTGSRPLTFAGSNNIDFECATPPESITSNATATITASGPTQSVTATTAGNHGLVAGNVVTISVAAGTPVEYANGGVAVTLTSASGSTFSYTLTSGLPPTVGGTGANLGTATYSAATDRVTVEVPGHDFVVGQNIVISGINGHPGFNGSFVVTASDPTTGFLQYSTGAALPPPSLPLPPAIATASALTQAEVTAISSSGVPHGCPSSVTISGATPASFNGTWSTIECPDSLTLIFSTGIGLSVPTGAITMSAGDRRAYATLANHGYSTGTQVTIQGANPTGYNVADLAITSLGSNHFSYLPGAGSLLGNASGTVTAGIKTTTARVYAVNHGLTNATPGITNRVTIGGAIPTAFNGTFNANVVDTNNFTYTLPSPQGDASGSIAAGPASGSGGISRDNLINWVRGQDTWEDENSGPGTDPNAPARRQDVRASIHGDVLHGRPVVINYSRYGGDNDVFVFYGSNDGVFHALKGGTGVDTLDLSGISPGKEVWGFVPPEFFSKLKRLYNNSPNISANNPKPYFMDGPVAAYIKNDDNSITTGGSDAVYLYVSMRRGGPYIYSLDVTDPLVPKFRWKITPDTDCLAPLPAKCFAEMGQTWSQPTVVSQGLPGWTNPVLIFGAGYDTVDDARPETISASTAADVVTSNGTISRERGRGVFIVDAITGQLIKSFGPADGMSWAIPSDVTVVRPSVGTKPTRAYVGDMGGNLWRIDFGNLDRTQWSVTKIATITDDSTGNRRKFMQAPDIVDGRACGIGEDLLLVGTGDREHPFDTVNANRFYMFKEAGNDSSAVTGRGIEGTGNPADLDVNGDGKPDDTIVEGDLYDVTNNCLQEVTRCPTTSGQTQEQAQAAAKTALQNARGWKLLLGTGEKVVSTAVTLNGVVFFNAYSPINPTSSNQCSSGLGTALLYQVAICNAASVSDRNGRDGVTVDDRAVAEVGRGYIPPPVTAHTELEDGKVHEVVISGTSVGAPPGVSLNTRIRRYWYKGID